MEREPNRSPPPQHQGISYRALFIGILSFIAGAAALLIFTSAVGAAQVAFSVTGIISFVFGVALSSASIVLAVAAISLGRASERTMVERSDESIRLQNAVFVKTTDALARIESSTGVTEKRIEDIIAGRAGAIAERLVEHRRTGPQTREEIENEIKESLRAELTTLRSHQLEPNEKEQEARIEEARAKNEAWAKYNKFKHKVLFHVSDQSSTKTRKIGDGHFGASGDDLADGVFETTSGRFAICAFSTDPVLGSRFGSKGEYSIFIDSILKELTSGVFQKVVFVFDGKLDADSLFAKQIEKRREVVKEELIRRIAVIDGEGEEVLEAITKEFAATTAAA